MKILLSYDGKESAQQALEYSLKHARSLNADLDIVTIVVRKSTDQSEDIETAEKLLTRAEKICREKNINCKTKLLINKQNAGEAIVDYAEGKGYEFIIVGITKTSKLGKLLLGSNAQYVILNATCPVLTVGKNKWI